MWGQLIELKTKSDLWEGPEGKEKLVKKGIIARRSFSIDQISAPSEIFGHKGQVLQKECSLYVRDEGRIIVYHSYNYICSLFNRREIGFNYSAKNKICQNNKHKSLKNHKQKGKR